MTRFNWGSLNKGWTGNTDNIGIGVRNWMVDSSGNPLNYSTVGGIPTYKPPSGRANHIIKEVEKPKNFNGELDFFGKMEKAIQFAKEIKEHILSGNNARIHLKDLDNKYYNLRFELQQTCRNFLVRNSFLLTCESMFSHLDSLIRELRVSQAQAQRVRRTEVPITILQSEKPAVLKKTSKVPKKLAKVVGISDERIRDLAKRNLESIINQNAEKNTKTVTPKGKETKIGSIEDFRNYILNGLENNK